MRLLIGIALVWFGGLCLQRITNAQEGFDVVGGLLGLVLAIITLFGLVFGWGI